MTKQALPKFTSQVRERSVRMMLEHGGKHATQRVTISSIVGSIGCNTETLRDWIRRTERDQGTRPSPTTDEQQRIKALEL